MKSCSEIAKFQIEIVKLLVMQIVVCESTFIIIFWPVAQGKAYPEGIHGVWLAEFKRRFGLAPF